MAASPVASNGGENAQADAKWAPQAGQLESQPALVDGADPANGTTPRPDDQPQAQQVEHPEDSASPATFASGTQPEASHRGEKQIKPNKVYIGGLPEHTRKEDLESCFGKIGNIVNIELKVGYGFVEFDNREAAEESVAKYHEGYFMGNKIRVELSHGGGRTAKYSNDPGACFKCGEVGHWARECPNQTSDRRGGPPLIDRIQPSRDYLPPPPPRDYPPYEYARYSHPRDVRYNYDYPPPPPPGRDYRRPPTPPREYRDYPPSAVARSSREVDDYRSRGPPPPQPPPARYDSRPGYYAEPDLPPPGYQSRHPAPSSRDYYERYDRRPQAPAPSDRYAPYPPAGRPRSPSGPPSLGRPRDDYDRPARDYPSSYAGQEYRGGTSERYNRRRSQSPHRPSSSAYDSGYTSNTGTSNYKNGFAGNGYSSGPPQPSRGGSSARDYPAPRSRDDDPGYRR